MNTQTTPYELVGGEAGVRRIVDRFYDIMDADPAAAAIRAMHAPDLGPMRETLFKFLSGWLGGPRLYQNCVMGAHGRFSIGETERDQWLACMTRALEETGVSDQIRELLQKPFFAMADAMCNR